MATLPTPILSPIDTFDPKSSASFSFYYTGNQIEKKRIIIIDNDTLQQVLDNTQLGMKLSYELASNVLSPGHQYTAQVQVFDFDGNYSEISRPILFYCYSTALFSFLDFNDRLNKPNLSVELSYSQSENDKLKEYVYYLYDLNKNVISKSDIFYTSDNYKYSFYGIKNLETYYVRCIGKTVHNMIVDTGFYKFSTDYIVPPNNMFIQVKNNRCEGYITVDCNIIDVGYDFEGNDPVFKNGEVMLNNSKVTYTSGYNFSDEFSIFIKARNIPINNTFFSFSTSSGDVMLSVEKIATKYYGVLKAKSVFGSYCRYTELPYAILTDPLDNMLSDNQGNVLMVAIDYSKNISMPVIFELKRKNNLYNLNVYYEDNGYVKL